MDHKKELESLLEFKKLCEAKGQTLSKPKFTRLTELLLMRLDGDNLDDNDRE